MKLISSAFLDGAAIPRRYTCEGENLSPPLAWRDAPSATKSFALVCNDPDAPAGTWHHWALYDMAPSKTSLGEGVSRREAAAFRQGANDFGEPGYGGPCPPPGHGPHHYEFRLLALSVDRLGVSSGARCAEIEREARRHLLAEASLVGIYER